VRCWGGCVECSCLPRALQQDMLALCGCPHTLLPSTAHPGPFRPIANHCPAPPLLHAVFFPHAVPGWLNWVASLACLQDLSLTAAAVHLQPEEGLGALLPLRRSLTGLRLDGCLVLTDHGAAFLAQFRCREGFGVWVWAGQPVVETHALFALRLSGVCIIVCSSAHRSCPLS